MGRKLISSRAWAKAEKHNADPNHEAEDRARDERRSSHGWGGLVTRHPVLAMLAGVLLLGIVALPGRPAAARTARRRIRTRGFPGLQGVRRHRSQLRRRHDRTDHRGR